MLTFITFGAMVGVSLLVLAFGDGNTRNWVSPPPVFSTGLIGSFGVALVAALFAYKGWEAATFSAGEIEKPGAQPAARPLRRHAALRRVVRRRQPRVPVPDGEATARRMRELGVYVAPLKGRVRVGLCVAPGPTIPRLVSALDEGVRAARA